MRTARLEQIHLLAEGQVRVLVLHAVPPAQEGPTLVTETAEGPVFMARRWQQPAFAVEPREDPINHILVTITAAGAFLPAQVFSGERPNQLPWQMTAGDGGTTAPVRLLQSLISGRLDPICVHPQCFGDPHDALGVPQTLVRHPGRAICRTPREGPVTRPRLPLEPLTHVLALR